MIHLITEHIYRGVKAFHYTDRGNDQADPLQIVIPDMATKHWFIEEHKVEEK